MSVGFILYSCIRRAIAYSLDSQCDIIALKREKQMAVLTFSFSLPNAIPLPGNRKNISWPFLFYSLRYSLVEYLETVFVNSCTCEDEGRPRRIFLSDNTTEFICKFHNNTLIGIWSSYMFNFIKMCKIMIILTQI